MVILMVVSLAVALGGNLFVICFEQESIIAYNTVQLP